MGGTRSTKAREALVPELVAMIDTEAIGDSRWVAMLDIVLVPILVPDLVLKTRWHKSNYSCRELW